jgi:hypothetical protein
MPWSTKELKEVATDLEGRMPPEDADFDRAVAYMRQLRKWKNLPDPDDSGEEATTDGRSEDFPFLERAVA